MQQDKTIKLDKFVGQYVKINYNVAQDVNKPSVLVSGILTSCRLYYTVTKSGDAWINFTDDNIVHIWSNESSVYIELKG